MLDSRNYNLKLKYNYLERQTENKQNANFY